MNQIEAAQKRLAKVLDNIKGLAQNDPDMAITFCEELEPMLNEIHGNDGFGTEGQCDPRGDFRNGDWSMDCVEGIDS